MKRFLLAAITTVFCALTSNALAATQTYTYRYGPISVGGYQVKQNIALGVDKPNVDGAITAMDVDVVDAAGKPVPIHRLMLHHIVFVNGGTGLGSTKDSTCPNIPGQRFYAAGEERNQLVLPSGYGLPTKQADRWGMVWMLMNHMPMEDKAYIQYHITVDTDPNIKPVNPYWLDVVQCDRAGDPIYDVPGGGKPGSVNDRRYTWTAPEAGRIVAGGGHVHGGGIALTLNQPSCGNREIARIKPTWGGAKHPFYNVHPVLHEPGPIHMAGFNSAQGIPVAQGQPIDLHSIYDAQRPHTRVMGILMIYVAPDNSIVNQCGALPTDLAYSKTSVAGRSQPPRYPVPLTGLNAKGKAISIAAPPGKRVAFKRNATVQVANHSFEAPNIEIPNGSKVTWKFEDKDQHNVTVADGPRGFSSTDMKSGQSFTQQFKVPGTYKIFCSLHPVDMTSTIKVDR